MGRISRGCSLAVLAAVFTTAVMLPASKAFAQAPADFTQNVKEVYFPFNIYNKIVDPAVLDANANWLKDHPDAHMWIQGYADIRGDIVYNLVLSYHRAQWIKGQLVKRGIDESRIGYATGWGKLYPVCEKTDDQCFQQNRRVDTVPPEQFTLASTQ
jgi:peptidoglycan-associated lipoprotein